MPPIDLPEIGSRWIFPPWNNPDFTGVWEVVTLGIYEPEGEGPSIALRRDEGRRQVTYALIAFWPGSWEPAD